VTLRALIRGYLFVSIFRACTESLASENASGLAARIHPADIVCGRRLALRFLTL